jgi:hypothetical protein
MKGLASYWVVACLLALVLGLLMIGGWYVLGLLHYRSRSRVCPHPPHRVRHIHGDERNYGYVQQCMECGKLFKDWIGGSHDATRCWC